MARKAVPLACVKPYMHKKKKKKMLVCLICLAIINANKYSMYFSIEQFFNDFIQTPFMYCM